MERQEVSKIYGISLENIEQIEAKNKEFFKLVDPATGNIKIIENLQKNFNLSEQFKRTQEDYSFAKNDSEIDNANNIFEFEQRYNRKELELISISDIFYENEGKLVFTSNFDRLCRNLNQIQIFELKQLLQASKIIGLKYINTENGIGIDSQNRVISSTYNETKGVCDIDLARILKFENDIKSVDSDSKELHLDNIDYEDIIKKLEVSNDTPIEIAGESITKSEIDEFYEYPEMVDKKDNISTAKKSIITKLLELLRIKKQNKGKQKILNNGKSTIENLLFIISVTAFIGGAVFIIII